MCYEILTELKKVGPDLDGPGVLLRVNPDIARALKEEERGVLRDLKALLGRDVIVKPDVHLHHEQHDVMSSAAERPPPAHAKAETRKGRPPPERQPTLHDVLDFEL